MTSPASLANPPSAASAAPTEAMRRPPTSELKAFAGMVHEPGCKPRTQQVHDQLVAAICSEPINCIGASPEVMEIAAHGAKSLEAWSLELIRVIQAGLTREQLVALLQYSATTAYKQAAELTSLAAEDRLEARRAANPYFRMGVEAMLDQRADALGEDFRERISESCDLLPPSVQP